MTGTPPEGDAWLRKARHDLEMAKRAMEPSGPLPDMACFHAQQCAEKCLKSFLVARRAKFQWVHDVNFSHFCASS